MGVNSLPKTVTRQRRGCDLNPGPPAPESSTLTTRLPSHPLARERIPVPSEVPKRRAASDAANTTPSLDIVRRVGVIVARLPIVRSLACLCISDGTASTIQPHHIRFPTALR